MRLILFLFLRCSYSNGKKTSKQVTANECGKCYDRYIFTGRGEAQQRENNQEFDYPDWITTCLATSGFQSLLAVSTNQFLPFMGQRLVIHEVIQKEKF